MSLFRRQKQKIRYDPSKQEPVVRKSICTGEMTAGFVDRDTGVFHDLMRLENQEALDAFCRQTGISEIRTIY